MPKPLTITYTLPDGAIVGESRNHSASILKTIMTMTLLDLAHKMVFSQIEPDKDFPNYKEMYAQTQVRKNADELWQELFISKNVNIGNITMVLS